MPSAGAAIAAKQYSAMQRAVRAMPPKRGKVAERYLDLLKRSEEWFVPFCCFSLLVFVPANYFVEGGIMKGTLAVLIWILVEAFCFWRHRIASRALRQLRASGSYWEAIARELGEARAAW